MLYKQSYRNLEEFCETHPVALWPVYIKNVLASKSEMKCNSFIMKIIEISGKFNAVQSLVFSEQTEFLIYLKRLGEYIEKFPDELGKEESEERMKEQV